MLTARTHRSRGLSAALLLLGALVALGGCTKTVQPDDGGPGETDADPLASVPEGYEPLVIGDWTLDANEETYLCIYKRVTETTFVTGFHSLAPEGTHHSLLTVLPETTIIDTATRCAPTALGEQLIFGSGVGTQTFELPEGVAVRLEPGQQLLMNLHLFNVRDRDLSGTSGVYARLVPETEVEQEAEVVLVGPQGFTIPPRTSNHRVSGTCTRPITQTAFAVMPHMHLYGTALTMTANIGGETRTLYDGSYTFDDQRYYPIEPTVIEPTDSLTVECVYDNPNASAVFFGESTLSEMCFGLTYLYPAVYDGVFCSD